MITLTALQWNNEIKLKYAHREPTAIDLRRMAEMLRREATNCDDEAQMLEDAHEAAECTKDERLP